MVRDGDATDRATQVIVLVTGFYTYRLMLPLEPLKGNPTPGMRDWLARSLQDIVEDQGKDDQPLHYGESVWCQQVASDGRQAGIGHARTSYEVF